MMEVSPSGLAARSQLVSNLAVAQLLVCFLAGLLRADSFVVAPLVALYAARERDRRALMLYGILVGAGILMDFVYLVAGAAVSWLAVGFAIVQLGLKLAVPPQPPARTAQPHRLSPRGAATGPACISPLSPHAHCMHTACTLHAHCAYRSASLRSRCTTRCLQTRCAPSSRLTLKPDPNPKT